MPFKETTSQKQIDANRRNALKSPGPVTARGRAISSQNARKFQLMPFEDPALPAQLTALFYGRLIPANKSERRLVDIIVYSERIRRHCLGLETRVRAEEIANTEGRSMKEALKSASRRLMMIPYYLDAADCAHRNALRQLQSIRTKAA